MHGIGDIFGISLIVLKRVIETHSTRNVLLFRKYELGSHTPHDAAQYIRWGHYGAWRPLNALLGMGADLRLASQLARSSS